MGGKPRRPAPAPDPVGADERRDQSIPLRVSLVERAVWGGAARRSGHTMSAWLRLTANRSAEGRARLLIVEIRREIDWLVGYLTPKVDEEDKQAVDESVAAIEAALFELRGDPP